MTRSKILALVLWAIFAAGVIGDWFYDSRVILIYWGIFVLLYIGTKEIRGLLVGKVRVTGRVSSWVVVRKENPIQFWVWGLISLGLTLMLLYSSLDRISRRHQRDLRRDYLDHNRSLTRKAP